VKYNIKPQEQTIDEKSLAPKLILFLDDNPFDFELAYNSLKSVLHVEYIYVKNIKEFKEAYSPQKFAAIFSDYSLDGEDCTEIIPIVRKQEIDLPIILISGTIGEEKAVELLRLGITDFVFKDRLLKLPFVLTRALKEYEVKKAERIRQMQIKVNE